MIFQVFEDTSYHGVGGMWQSVSSTSKVQMLISYCLLSSDLFVPICLAICSVKPKSCNRGYVHSCIPWILEDFTNDPWAGTANDFNCGF